MEIFRKYKELECGINDDGDLFLGDDRSGYNIPDTPKNRERLLDDFEYYKEQMIKDYDPYCGPEIC